MIRGHGSASVVSAIVDFMRPSWATVFATVWLLLAMLLLSGCKVNESEYRFRMSVEVETPEGTVSGSSVLQVNAWAIRPGLNGHVRSMSLKGEAVAVDLPGGQTLFALLRTRGASSDRGLAIASMAALDPSFDYDWVESAARIGRSATDRSENGMTQTAILDNEEYPMLVAFGDIAEPSSVELVDPDNLAASFGEGVELRRIIVEMTDDPATEGIEERLGWLETAQSRTLDAEFAPTTKPSLAQSLNFLDFRRE